MKQILFVSILLCVSLAFTHEGRHHGPHTSQAKAADTTPDVKLTYEEINNDYISSTKTIFNNKCAACHSNEVQAPWYAKVPGVGWIVESDRSEAKEHLEISKGFPFAGHGTPEEDLKAIHEVIQKDEMPTRLYSLFHLSSKLTEDEKTKILAWVNRSQGKLENLNAVPGTK